MTVRGVVTVAPGRLLAEGFLVIQDATGGIGLRVPEPADAGGLAPGRHVQVTGPLADPYGNLEIRPGSGDVTVLGSAAVPSPRALGSGDVSEATEGLLGRLTGSIERVEAGSSGSFALTVSDDGGEVRVFVFGTTGMVRDRFQTGQRVRATGIVSQRELSSDAGDGHRLWPRQADDLVILAGPAPSPTVRRTPRPTPRSTPRPTPRTSARPTGRVVPTPPPGRGASSIATALGRGGTATVAGTVTAPAGLLDGDRRRVTIQDRTGALLVRVPEAVQLPAVGTEVRVSGAIGTYYNAPQLEADGEPYVIGRRSPDVSALGRPPTAAQEWALVRVSGTVADVARSGAAWRAELTLVGGGGSLPVAGLSTSGIPADAMVEGRSATVTGLVRRAYPTATDQRFAVVPRTGADIVLGAPGGAGSGDGGGGTPRSDGNGGTSAPGAPGAAGAPGAPGGTAASVLGSVPGSGGGIASGASTGAGGALLPGGVADIDLADLATFDGRTVRVGGRVTDVTSELIVIDDGTAQAPLRVREGRFSIDLAPEVGILVNAIGVATASENGTPEVVMTSLADISTPARILTVAAYPSLAPSPPPAPIADVSAGSAPPDRMALLMALAGLVVATIIASAVAFVWWRRRRPDDQPLLVDPTAVERA